LNNTIFISAFNVKSLGSVRILCDLTHELHKLRLFEKIVVNCNNNINSENFPKEVVIIRSGIWDSNFLLKIIWQYIGLWVHSYFNHYQYIISLNNLTPNFRSEFSILYLHNALPFADYVRPSDGRWLGILFQQFYLKKFLPIGMKRNNLMVVQQSILKHLVLKRFDFMKDKVKVLPPRQNYINNSGRPSKFLKDYLYLPVNDYCYKNADSLMIAFCNLGPEYANLDLVVTLDENCNLVKNIKRKKNINLKNIKFIGPQSWEDNISILENSNALLWGSSIESWCLPLSEAMMLNVDIIAPRLPYVEETLKLYERIYFYPEINEKSIIEGIAAWRVQKKSTLRHLQTSKITELSKIFNLH